jgi:hypothetical protein
VKVGRVGILVTAGAALALAACSDDVLLGELPGDAGSSVEDGAPRDTTGDSADLGVDTNPIDAGTVEGTIDVTSDGAAAEGTSDVVSDIANDLASDVASDVTNDGGVSPTPGMRPATPPPP